MVVSLYVCDIPQNIEKEELDSVFGCFDGFVEVRLAKDKNRQTIAFVDYEKDEHAKYAMNSTKGFRFASSTKGITVRFSENTKGNQPPQKRRDQGQGMKQQAVPNRPYTQSPNIKDQHYAMPPPSEMPQQNPSYYAQKQYNQPINKVSQPNLTPQSQQQNLYPDQRNVQEIVPNMQQQYPSSGGGDQAQQLQGQPNDLFSFLNNINNMNSGYQPQIDMSQLGGQNASILNTLLGSITSGGNIPQGQPASNPLLAATSLNQAQSQSQKFSDSLSRIQSLFGQNIMPIPKNATNTVYVEGIPLDASEREVAHIFRPFPGFKSVRLIHREKKPGEKVILCFADFENAFQTTLVVNTLQGYRFDKDDILGLQFSYAITNNKYSTSKYSSNSGA